MVRVWPVYLFVRYVSVVFDGRGMAVHSLCCLRWLGIVCDGSGLTVYMLRSLGIMYAMVMVCRRLLSAFDR